MADKEINNNNQNDLTNTHEQLFSQATLTGLFSGYPFVLPNNYFWTNFVVPSEPGNSGAPTPSIALSSLLASGNGGTTMNMDQVTQNVAWMSYLLQFQMFQQMYAQYLAQHMSQPVSLSTLSSSQVPNACYIDGQIPLNPPLDPTSTSGTPPTPPQGNNVNNNNNNVIDAPAPGQEPIVGAARLEPAVPAAGVRLAPAPALAPAEEDEDFVQRDWIDWLSLITRAVALASFIYLYASFGRFMLVTVLYFLYRLMTSIVEAYNAFLAIGAPRQAAQQPADQQNNRGANNNNNNLNNQNDGPNRLQQVMDGNINEHQAPDPVTGQRNSNEPTKIRLLFTMVKALFSSLIPLQTQPL